MITILNPSFENVFSDWGRSYCGTMLYRAIVTDWATDGQSSAESTFSSTSNRTAGDYLYWTQSINFTSFTLIIDFEFVYSNSNYEFRVYVDSTLEYQIATDGSTHTNIEIPLSYTGSHQLKFGLYCVTGDTSLSRVRVDNLRVKGQNYYIKTTGDDTKDGLTWVDAWKTINKAATTVTDGKIVHIGFGTYDAEPVANKIAPQNIGTSGIYYLPEQAPGGSATPIVSIEQNA